MKDDPVMIEQIEADVAALRAQILLLSTERAALTISNVVDSENSSPQAISEAYRRYAREESQLYAEVKGIDDALRALEVQLRQKEASLKGLLVPSRQLSLEEEVQQGREDAIIHAQRINELAAELAIELRALKSIANQLSPSYWRVYYKPFITGFKTISVPYVRSDGDVWTIVNRIV